MNAVQQVLIDAKARISDPAKWGKGKDDCEWSLPRGQECAAVAIKRAGSRVELETCEAAWNALRQTAGESNLPRWNDAPERTHADVMKAFDAAIELTGKS
jgi:hypothetical protein